MDDLDRKRADLKARIDKAQLALDYCNRCEAELAKETAKLRKGKAQLHAAGPSARLATTNKSIAAAELKIATTSAGSIAETRATATKVLQLLQAELDALTK